MSRIFFKEVFLLLFLVFTRYHTVGQIAHISLYLQRKTCIKKKHRRKMTIAFNYFDADCFRKDRSFL